MDENLLFWLWLNSIKGIGPATARLLLDEFQDPESIYRAKREDFVDIPGIGQVKADILLREKSLSSAKAILETCNRLNIAILTLNDPLYQPFAKEINKAPVLLYYRGIIREDSIGVAIVGSRRCTEYGKRVTVEAAEFLAQHNISVISGMAKGIDSYAHTACLNKNGYTLAFVGCGVDICYPEEHRELMKKIIEHGAVISEYPPGVRPEANHFPERNRLISGWSEKVLIVEASEKSGALITADIGRKQGREVLAVPNGIHAKESSGTNRLIQAGAGIYLNPEQLLLSRQVYIIKKDNTIETSDNTKLSLMENKIIGMLKDNPMTINELIECLKENKDTLIEQISIMELEGKIKSIAGGRLIA